MTAGKHPSGSYLAIALAAIADRWGPRWVMITGVVLLAAANAAAPYAGSAIVLTLLIGVMAAAPAWISFNLDHRRRLHWEHFFRSCTE